MKHKHTISETAAKFLNLVESMMIPDGWTLWDLGLEKADTYWGVYALLPKETPEPPQYRFNLADYNGYSLGMYMRGAADDDFVNDESHELEDFSMAITNKNRRRVMEVLSAIRSGDLSGIDHNFDVEVA